MDYAKIVGLRRVSFTGKDGREVSGVTVYYTEQLPPGQGEGQMADRVFVSSARLAELGFDLRVGMEVQFVWGRSGSLRSIVRADLID